ncbi:selenide, water dikinase SelD [Lutimaribacter sp. EGI FJ00015]|uniref:Selenide, water dikinase SelD n=1 Tax=Lutimaribacter degradans TaxID=2945989 RepID=A0ACC5ZX06_9RHOB|nr:selenide, water dikinase SelD [Lutimaribacter sp. EGI FJ00013]MCM2562864.1 selenide, water dikinase SelD [Lutimaribacter sp. EGI FJ00013]MCO0614021.1 selenide, water dikinase SelD [Lutimaribacter sp. EGI FJ00015]MCO0636993.1 selenide, water dikinase SelD [Lutimaribacter sp. EGI FJ00014]
MQSDLPLTRDIVLVGGGHTHALVLRKWGMAPLPGVRLTMINPGATAPYSGMLPGHIAGHYTREELEIDLLRLARFAGARVILDRAVGFDRDQRLIHLKNRPPVAYDIASIDIGITAEMDALPGFAEHAVGAKPLDIYSDRWRDFRARVAAGQAAPQVAVIGGGVAGVELSMAMAHALRSDGATPGVTVIESGEGINGVPHATGRKLARAMTDQGVRFVAGTRAQEVTAQGVVLPGGEMVRADLVVGAAGAYPHGWLADTDLPLTDGFINIDETLQVQSDPALFACGDCAHMVAHPRPKAGVFAVRAAPILFDNLRAAASGTPLRIFKPQRDYLKLISLGGKVALAEKLGFALSGPLLWRWKNRIDTKFMHSLDALPQMDSPTRPATMAQGVADILDAKPLCGGCGAKLGGDVLQQSLDTLKPLQRPDVLTGPGDDAAVLRIGDQRQVITTDHLRAFVDDPYMMARITAVHALGDIWAMGAQPQAALVQIILPRMAPHMQARTMDEVMSAANDVFTHAGAGIVGGHSTMGSELTIGFTVTGLVAGSAPITVTGARAGDALIVTRPIGSGTVLAADMMGQANGRHVAAMLAQMAKPQGDAAQLLAGAHAMTDVTGFGLAGHLMTICRASGLSATLTLDAVPIYDGAEALAAQGHHSTLFQPNRDAAPVLGADTAKAQLLHDPQTAGGLLAAVAPDQAEGLVMELRAAGHDAAVIGHLSDGPASITLR